MRESNGFSETPTVTPSRNFFEGQSHVQAMLSGGEVHGLMIQYFTLLHP
jgi:hypothetical protein